MIFSAETLSILMLVASLVSIIWTSIEPESFKVTYSPFRLAITAFLGLVYLAWAMSVLVSGWWIVLAVVGYLMGLVFIAGFIKGVKDAG